jgi:hypothetical protein
VSPYLFLFSSFLLFLGGRRIFLQSSVRILQGHLLIVSRCKEIIGPVSRSATTRNFPGAAE